jgi:cytochrome b involved in lipid metabolism
MTRDNKKKYENKKQDEHTNKPIIQQTWVDMVHEGTAHSVQVEKLKTTSQSGNDGDTKQLLHTTKKETTIRTCNNY